MADCQGDATPFTDVTVHQISQALKVCGYQQRGFEVLYNVILDYYEINN